MNLEEIKARAEKATPGPWKYDKYSDNLVVENGYEAYLGELKGKDVEFLVHAREDVPALIAEVERLRAELDGR